MEIKIINSFITVANIGSITGAAKLLHISQPALSNQLHQLEEEVGHKLLERGKKQITLTEAGLFLLDKAQTIVNLADTTIVELNSLGSELKGKINIGISEGMGGNFVAKAIAKFNKDHGDVRFHIKSIDRRDALSMLERHDLDMATVIDSVDMRKFQVLKLPCIINCGLLLRKDSPFSHVRAITPASIKKIQIIVARTMANWAKGLSWFGESIDKINILGTYDTSTPAIELVRENVCAALIPESVSKNIIDPDLVFLPFDPPVYCDEFLIWSRDTLLQGASSVFLSYMETVIRQNWLGPVFALSD